MSTPDQERDQLRTINCATVLEHAHPPWTLDRYGSTRRALKYRRGEGEIIIVCHDGRGWWDPLGAAKGDVFALMQHLDPTMNFGQVRQALRPLLGLSPSHQPTDRGKRSPASARPLSERWHRRPVLRPGSPAWRYLTSVRCLPPSIVRVAAHADAIREGPNGSAWLAHRDNNGTLTHIEVRGPTFKGSLPGGHKTLFRIASHTIQPSKLVLAEGPITALSIAALDGLPTDTIYAATGGGIGPGTEAAIAALLTDLTAATNAQLLSATDADTAGDRYAARHQEIAKAAGIAFRRLRPPQGTDWNDVLRAIVTSDGPAADSKNRQ